MSREFPNTPFEDLHDFSDLNKLTSHILESLRVKDITAYIPSIFDAKLINDPNAILPVHYIVVGNATFQYIRHKADYVISHINKRIRELNQNKELSFTDRLQEYEGVRKNIDYDYRYFDSMNMIRYMSAYEWRISYTEEEEGRTILKEMTYPNSKLELTEGHWNEIEITFSIRRHLLYEILYLIDVEIQKLRTELTGTRYSWVGERPYELYELLAALLASERIKFEKGDRNTFSHDFLSLFSVSGKELAYPMDKVISRKTRSQFLKVLEEALERRVTKDISKSRK